GEVIHPVRGDAELTGDLADLGQLAEAGGDGGRQVDEVLFELLGGGSRNTRGALDLSERLLELDCRVRRQDEAGHESGASHSGGGADIVERVPGAGQPGDASLFGCLSLP